MQVDEDKSYVLKNCCETPVFFNVIGQFKAETEEKIKFPKKLHFWHALGKFGHVSGVFAHERFMNSKIHLQQCLIAQLIL